MISWLWRCFGRRSGQESAAIEAMGDEELIEHALDRLLAAALQRMESGADSAIVAVAFDGAQKKLLEFDMEEPAGGLNLQPQPDPPEESSVWRAWRLEQWPEMVERLRKTCAEQSVRYCGLASAARVVLKRDTDTMLPALYCRVETAETSLEVISIPDDGEADFLRADLRTDVPEIMC